MLKAIGARSRTLFGGVVVQAVVVALDRGGDRLRRSLCSSTARCRRARFPYQLLPSRVIVSSVALVLAARGRAARSRFGACCASTRRPRSGGPREQRPVRPHCSIERGAQGVSHRRRRGRRARSRDAHDRPRRDRRARRAVGIGQDHALLDRRRHPLAHRGQRRGRGRRHLRLLAEAAHRLPPRPRGIRLPDRQPRALPHRTREPARRRRDRASHRRPGPQARRPAARGARPRRPQPTTCPRRCRAASANASPSAAR